MIPVIPTRKGRRTSRVEWKKPLEGEYKPPPRFSATDQVCFADILGMRRESDDVCAYRARLDAMSRECYTSDQYEVSTISFIGFVTSRVRGSKKKKELKKRKEKRGMYSLSQTIKEKGPISAGRTISKEKKKTPHRYAQTSTADP